VLPFKDNILLVANDGFISYMDLSIGFPFTTAEFEKHYIDLSFQKEGTNGVHKNADKCKISETEAPLGMAFAGLRTEVWQGESGLL
jgi:hypothetical protein